MRTHVLRHFAATMLLSLSCATQAAVLDARLPGQDAFNPADALQAQSGATANLAVVWASQPEQQASVEHVFSPNQPLPIPAILWLAGSALGLVLAKRQRADVRVQPDV